MDSISGLPQQIIEALEREWIVLTANQRAARTLRRAFDLRQRARGIAFWQPPVLLAWDAWLEDQWRRLLINGHATDLLLNSSQEQSLWRDLIAADNGTASLRPVDSLAQIAADAHLRLHQFRARRLLETYPGNADTRAFARWANEFDRRCTRSHYLLWAQLAEAIRIAVVAGHVAPQAGILLVGFDWITPAQTALLDALRANGLPIEQFAPPPAAPSLILADAPDEYSELTACASWIRARLTNEPNASIAVILPAIETSRTEIDRVFRHILAPELDSIAAPASTGPYEFSLGIPLAQTPLAATALDILRWAIAPLALDRISALMLSPYFAAAAGDAEHNARAEFDAFTLRDQHLLQPVLSLNDLLRLVSNSRFGASLPTLQDRLRALRPLFSAAELTRAKRTHAEWTAILHDILEAAGWAVPSQLDSIEFQTRRKWESVLDDLTRLDFDGVRPSFSDALAALERIASDTLFAPESRHAPVQIMGPLESAGSSFDAIWFLRANDLAWPSRPSSNPLLPWPMQREVAMPGVDPARDADHARRITTRIAGSAPTIIFSYAHESAEGRQRPSSTLKDLRPELRSAFNIAPTTPMPARIQLDAAVDSAPLPQPPDAVQQGGAGILQLQAACGFRAFAEKRLFSSSLESTSLGLDASDRGSLVHAVLEDFWAEIKDQATLKAMSGDQRTTQLKRCIDVAFAKDYSHPVPGWARAYIDGERHRLLRLLLDWLEFEESREPFAVKKREEKLSDVSIGPLRLDIRVDRVDTNLSEDGEPAGDIILDYKTGAATPRDWLGPRPDAPQLPLYAVVANSPDLAAIAFASVRPGNLMGIAGYEAGGPGQSRILPKVVKVSAGSLDAQVDEWRAVLTSLAEEFHAGNASVTPKHYPQTCEYCEQRLLCRLNPTALDPDILEDIDEESDTFSQEENDFA
ncbi:MAG: PD-(D/E)XK nuclease family protein [Acidobacteriota bacterium]|nr:PD-(D/E)XK nuclease family protein [Acidobacteriota bacterium]